MTTGLQEVEEMVADRHWIVRKMVKIYYFFKILTHPFVFSAITTSWMMNQVVRYKKWRSLYCDECLHKKEMTAYDKRVCRNCHPKNSNSEKTFKQASVSD